MEIISDLSKICSGTVILCKANEVIMPAYVLNNFNDIYYLYVQNRIMAIEIQHTVKKVKIMKTRKHFIRKYELLARCIQTNLELFILQQ